MGYNVYSLRSSGSYGRKDSDAKKFKELGVKIYDNEIAGVPVLFHDEFVKLRGAFQQYGVTIKDNGGLVNANEYFIDGKLVSRDDAWKHIEAQFNK